MRDLYERQKRYYDLRAQEYDSTSWEATDESETVLGVIGAVAALSPARTLDVACGTGFVSQHLRGDLTLLDASSEMPAIATTRLPDARFVHGDALPLPFPDGSLGRISAAPSMATFAHRSEHVSWPKRAGSLTNWSWLSSRAEPTIRKAAKKGS